MKLSNIFAFAGMAFLSMTIFSSVVTAQGFDVEAYLKRKDSNNNGKVDPSEMSNNTKSYLGKFGLDTSKPISISKVMSKVRKSESDKAKAAKKANTVAKVPGFGADGGEKNGVSSFSFNSSASKTKGVSNAASTRYSDSVSRQVESTLEKYDRNKDGSLDKSEQGRARWGSPSVESSDLNKDGKLSRDELAKRYKGREDYYKNSRTSRRGSTNEDSRRSRDRTRSTSSYSRSGSSRTPTKTSTTSSKSNPSSKDDRSKYLKYAKSLVESYDKDKDGKLSKEEVKAMRRPPTGADTDKDGFISESELVDNLSGANKSKSTSTSSSSSKSRYSSRSRGGTSSRSRRGSESFESLDANKDNQIQMHEYSKKWDDEIVAQFYEKDKNGDGIITSQEWSSK